MPVEATSPPPMPRSSIGNLLAVIVRREGAGRTGSPCSHWQRVV